MKVGWGNNGTQRREQAIENGAVLEKECRSAELLCGVALTYTDHDTLIHAPWLMSCSCKYHDDECVCVCM